MTNLNGLEIFGMVLAEFYLLFSVKTFDQFVIFNGLLFVILLYHVVRKGR